MNPARKRAYFELFLVAIIWGTAAPIIKYTLGGFSPAVFVTYRFFISAMVAFAIFAFTGIKFPKNPRVFWIVILNGFLLTTVTIGLLFFGTNKTTSIDSNLISAMSPIIIAVAGVLFLKEHVTRRESIGMLVALTGTVITVIGPVLKVNDGFGGLEGNLLVLASVIIGAATAILAKKVLRGGVDALFVTNISFIVGFLTMIPIVLALNPGKDLVFEIASVPLKYHLGVIYMALLSGTLAYFLWHKAEKTIEVGEVNLIAYLYPILGAPLSIFWLKESIDFSFIIGSLLIMSGVALAQIKKKRYT
jgi:drug/metabolite transporter (DMT)-like permease